MDEKELLSECASEDQEVLKHPSEMTFEELTALLDESYQRTLSPPAPPEGEEASAPDGEAKDEQTDAEKDPETQQVEDAEEELREFLESLNEEEKNAFFTKMAERFGEQFEEIVALIEELDPSFRVDREEELEEEADEAEASDITPPDAPRGGVDEETGERIIPPPYSTVPSPYSEASAQADADDVPHTEQAFDGEASEQESETEPAVDAPQTPLETNGEGGEEGITSTSESVNTPTDAADDGETSLLDAEARSAAESLSQALQTVLESCEKLRAVYRACGFCQSCGGSFKGIFRRRCRQCGKPKDYKGPSFFKCLAARRSLKRQAPKQSDEIE